MLKFFVAIMAVLVFYFFATHVLEYRYWKKEQEQAVIFIDSVVNAIKNRSRNELEDDLNSLQLIFASEKSFVPYHENVEKLAKIFILNDTLSPGSQNYFAFRTRYIKAEAGLRPGCHFDYLVLLYQMKLSLPQLKPSGFCQGWNELHKDFEFGWRFPHARSALKY